MDVVKVVERYGSFLEGKFSSGTLKSSQGFSDREVLQIGTSEVVPMVQRCDGVNVVHDCVVL